MIFLIRYMDFKNKILKKLGNIENIIENIDINEKNITIYDEINNLVEDLYNKIEELQFDTDINKSEINNIIIKRISEYKKQETIAKKLFPLYYYLNNI